MKISRQSKILEIIEKNEIETQEELAEHLKAAGFRATQATVSRDIKELKLIKLAGSHGKQKYGYLNDISKLYSERVSAVFRESVLSVDTAAFLVVLRTLPASAQAAAMAVDSMEWPEIVGTIAGDDTIFVAVRDVNDVNHVAEQFKKLMKM